MYCVQNWWECALQTELPVLYERASGKIAHKTLENHHLAAENGKRATKRAKNTSTLFRVAEHFKPADLSGITQRCFVFLFYLETYLTMLAMYS